MSRPADARHPASPLASLRLQEKVPFITAWSGEAYASPRVVWRGDRISYRTERASDRDAFGVLWRRSTDKPGHGKPLYGTVHSRRQRRAMGGLLCQVCGKPVRSEATDDGVLFLLSREEYEWDPWPAPITTSHPPVCVRCAALSGRACPHLRGHYVGVRCRAPRLHGVNGVMHLPRSGTVPVRDMAAPIDTVPYTEARSGLVHAAQAVMRLDRYTLVDLEAEASALAA